ncbi:MAG: ferritin family protein [bacterium]|nr:MAG: ferritin family protein [bacterium]
MSDERKAHVEALQMAMDTEKKGYRFYRIAAESSRDPKGKKVFEHLAKDEIEHMGVFATLYESLTNDEPWMTYEEAVAKFGQTDQDKLIFPDEPVEAEENFDDLKALEEALGFEKKAVAFYQNQAEKAEDDTARAFYQSLVVIEEGHVKIIQAEIDSLTGTGFWLDYQEISLEH